MARKSRKEATDGLEAFAESVDDMPALSKREEAFLKELEQSDEATLFHEGRAFLEQKLNVLIMPSATASTTCYISFYARTKPQQVPGLTIPDTFYYGEPLSSDRYNELLGKWRETLKDMPSLAHAMFWFPVLATGQAISPPIAQYISKILKLDAAWNAQFEGVGGYDQGICINPEKAIAKGLTPRAFVPAKAWFNEKIRQLKAEHIITLMPKAELAMFMLFLGRTVCGRANSRPIGESELLSHQFRKMAILYGQDPRTGKSTTCTTINLALKKLGFSIANFRGLGHRFNMGPVLQSDMAFKDDATQQSAEQMLCQEQTKMLVSGAPMVAEDKGKDAFSITPTCTVIFITNSFDQNALFGKDAGIIDRLAILYTYTHAEFQRISVVTPFGESPNPRPYEHLNWLAEECDTTPEVLMMWLFRMCADRFLASLEAESLEADITRITDKLRFPIAHQVLPNVVSAMLLATALRKEELLPLSNKLTLGYVLSSYAFLVGDLSMHSMRCMIKDDWMAKGRPPLHPWHGIRMISKVSIANMLEAQTNCLSNSALRLDEMLKSCFGQLQTMQGIHIGSSRYYITRAWQDIIGTAWGDTIKEMALQLKEQHANEPRLTIAHDLLMQGGQPDMQYVESIGFDPDKVASRLQELYDQSAEPIDFAFRFGEA